MQDTAASASQATDPALHSQSPDFADELRARVADAGPHSLLAGNITLIGLDRIKARLGSRWTDLAERAHCLTRNTIARHLTPGDLYTVWRETNYIIVFGNVPQRHAQMRCRLIAAEVAKALLGEDDTEELDVKGAVVTLEGNIALAEMPSIAELLDSALNTADAAPETPATEADHAAAPGMARPAGVPAPIQTASQPQFVFRPIWDPTLSVLSTYRCGLVGRLEPHGGERHGPPTDNVAQVDYVLQKRVLEELGRMARDGRKLLLIVPVQFETLAAGATRRCYVEALAEGAASDAAKLLVIEMVGVPSGVPHSRLIELMAPLRRHCRSVVARVPLEIGDLTAFKGTGMHAVGCDLGGTSASELVLMQLMGRFQRVAERAEVATYIRGLRSHSLTAAALGAGFRYLEGDGIAKAVACPEAVLEFRLFDVYRPLVGAPGA